MLAQHARPNFILDFPSTPLVMECFYIFSVHASDRSGNWPQLVTLAS